MSRLLVNSAWPYIYVHDNKFDRNKININILTVDGNIISEVTLNQRFSEAFPQFNATGSPKQKACLIPHRRNSYVQCWTQHTLANTAAQVIYDYECEPVSRYAWAHGILLRHKSGHDAHFFYGAVSILGNKELKESARNKERTGRNKELSLDNAKGAYSIQETH